MKILELNDGWTQIPPKEDGEYWMANAKPWHSENAYDLDLLRLVRIQDGKRVEEMDGYSEKWIPPDCDAPGNPVWDSESQFEMLAAWRLRRNGESFSNLPPEITATIFERHPATCAICGQIAATYWVTGETTRECPRLCYSCGYETMMPKDYFDAKFVAAFKAALEADDVTRSANDGLEPSSRSKEKNL
jgi:hypothetical protein